MTGKVWITGAGSEAGLITVSGLKALREAQVVVYDDLLDHSLLREVPEGCEKVCVGKRKNSHKMEQEEIHALLIDRARKGLQVVRLKGGDPTVFGRGGEEALALEEAGIPYEMIPGVSSCISALEHFGIPITHRGAASSFTVVTGHGAGKTAESFTVLAGIKGTLVFLMGHSRAREIADGLLQAGMDPDTPACVLSCAFMPNERRVDGRLAALARIAGEVPAPAILVIGKTAAMHLQSPQMSAVTAFAAQAAPEEAIEQPTAENTEAKPGAAENAAQPGAEDSPAQPAAAENTPAQLTAAEAAAPAAPHRTVLIVGTRSFTGRMAAALEEDGIHAIQFPCIEIIPQIGEIPEDEELKRYDWLVFTSANGAGIFLEEISRRKTDVRSLAHMKIACIGKGTAAELEKAHLYADLIPESFTTQGLARELSRRIRRNEKILILRAVEGNPVLTNILKNEKILYRDCKIYRTQYCVPETAGELYFDSDEPEALFDGIIFASAGGARSFLQKHKLHEKVRAFCIGALTAAEFERLTGREAVIAGECSVEGIRCSLRKH